MPTLRTSMSTIKELKEQIRTLQAQVEAQKSQELPSVIAEIREKIEEYGITVEQLFADSGESKQEKSSHRASKSKVEMKYQFNGEQWSGRGKMPKAMQAEIDAGRAKSKADFLIKQ